MAGSCRGALQQHHSRSSVSLPAGLGWGENRHPGSWTVPHGRSLMTLLCSSPRADHAMARPDVLSQLERDEEHRGQDPAEPPQTHVRDNQEPPQVDVPRSPRTDSLDRQKTLQTDSPGGQKPSETREEKDKKKEALGGDPVPTEGDTGELHGCQQGLFLRPFLCQHWEVSMGEDVAGGASPGKGRGRGVCQGDARQTEGVECGNGPCGEGFGGLGQLSVAALHGHLSMANLRVCPGKLRGTHPSAPSCWALEFLLSLEGRCLNCGTASHHTQQPPQPQAARGTGNQQSPLPPRSIPIHRHSHLLLASPANVTCSCLASVSSAIHTMTATRENLRKTIR